MKKRNIVTAAITACLALCAAVWPQAETVGETPAPPQTPAVSAPEPIAAEVKLGHHRTTVSAAFAQSFAPSVQL